MALMTANNFRHVPVVRESPAAAAGLLLSALKLKQDEQHSCLQVSEGNYLGMISIRDTVRFSSLLCCCCCCCCCVLSQGCAGASHGGRAQERGQGPAGVHPRLLLSSAQCLGVCCSPSRRLYHQWLSWELLLLLLQQLAALYLLSSERALCLCEESMAAGVWCLACRGGRQAGPGNELCMS